jgi:DNA-binding MarR family transcriptional regulator
MTARGKRPQHRFAYSGLDRLMHERARLGVLTSLLAHPKGLVFASLKQLCGLTDGNLSRHLLVLEEAGLIEVTKRVWLGRSQTICRITPDGRRRFQAYLEVLEQVLVDAAAAGTKGGGAADLGLASRAR